MDTQDKYEQLYYKKYDGMMLIDCLYLQKKYAEAKEIFEECLENKLDTKYAANNYVRVLIALKRNKEAKEFIKKGEFNHINHLQLP